MAIGFLYTNRIRKFYSHLNIITIITNLKEYSTLLFFVVNSILQSLIYTILNKMRMLPKNELIIVILCILWYTVSSSNAIVSKTILSHFPFPMTVSIVQLSSIYFFLKPILMYLKASEKQVTFERRYFWRMIIPLALGKFAAALSSHISIWKVPISYSHTGNQD